MAGGSWKYRGITPAHPVAWCKSTAGRVTPTTIFNASQNVTIQPYSANGQIVKFTNGSAGRLGTTVICPEEV